MSKVKCHNSISLEKCVNKNCLDNDVNFNLQKNKIICYHCHHQNLSQKGMIFSFLPKVLISFLDAFRGSVHPSLTPSVGPLRLFKNCVLLLSQFTCLFVHLPLHIYNIINTRRHSLDASLPSRACFLK